MYVPSFCSTASITLGSKHVVNKQKIYFKVYLEKGTRTLFEKEIMHFRATYGFLSKFSWVLHTRNKSTNCKCFSIKSNAPLDMSKSSKLNKNCTFFVKEISNKLADQTNYFFFKLIAFLGLLIFFRFFFFL